MAMQTFVNLPVTRGFLDPDGHQWSFIYMDMATNPGLTDQGQG
jgi:hypothetical protein